MVPGDCLVVLPKIPSGAVDLIFADPPCNSGKKFGNFIDSRSFIPEYAEWCSEWLNEYIRILLPTGSRHLRSRTQAMPVIDIWLRERFHILSRIVWTYDSSEVQARNYFGSLNEPILHCVKNKKEDTFNADDILVEARTGAVRNPIDDR